MELRQLRDFVRVVELGSMGRAAQELGVVTSALGPGGTAPRPYRYIASISSAYAE